LDLALRDLEHLEQAQLMAWAESQIHVYPQLANLFAIPNGGHRHPGVALKLKAEGVRSGVLDLFLGWPSGSYHGLFIEMKIKPNKPSNNQKEWIERLNKAGYCCCVAYSFEEAKEDILNYLNHY
jgi:hypothetical protein